MISASARFLVSKAASGRDTGPGGAKPAASTVVRIGRFYRGIFDIQAAPSLPNFDSLLRGGMAILSPWINRELNREHGCLVSTR